ncbi:MAG: ABC transporter permease [Candidatus Bathyarchaeota archaeon]|nr:MAG: ABC transporter permease [Candidatus Bathyarchaeota archaeon]
MRGKWLLLLYLLVFANTVMRTPLVNGDSDIHLEGFVLGSDGSPLQGATILLWGLHLEGDATSDQSGYFSLKASTDEETCMMYAYLDDPATPGVDMMPAVRSIATTGDLAEQVNFTLVHAATVHVRGQLRYIESTNVITKYAFEVMDPTTGAVMRVDDHALIYGADREALNSILDIDPGLVIVPAGVPVKIEVSYSYMYEKTRRGLIGWSISIQRVLEAFGRFEISDGDDFVLGAGEVVDLDIRKYSLASDLVMLEKLRVDVEQNLTRMESAGFYTASQRHQLRGSDELVQSGTSHLEAGNYDASYVELRQAYLKLDGVKDWLETVAVEASLSVSMLIAFVSLTSVAAASLLTDSAPRKLLVASALYVPMLLFLHRVYPGSGAVTAEGFLGTSLFSLSVALFIEGAVPRILGQREGRGGLSRLAAIPVIFAMAKRNLRKRRLRTSFTFSTLLTLTMSFVALTSLSTGYGLTYNPITSHEPGAEGILVRLQEYQPRITWEEGWFYPVVQSVIDWAAGVDGVANVALKAENTPTLGPYARVGDAPIFGILGVQPDREPMMDTIDDAVVVGDPLREDGRCLLEESLLKTNEVALGGSIVVRGIRMRVVGFFSRDVRLVMDLDGEAILPKYQINYEPGSDIPLIDAVTCDPVMVAITTVDTALRIRGVDVSRIGLELEKGVDAEVLGKSMALTREYRFWVSSGGVVRLAQMEDLLGGKGLPLLVPWTIVVLNVVATMMNTMYERRREIGILSSVGLNPAHVSGIFLAEASIIGVTAGGFGYLLGLGWYPLMARLSFAPVVQQKISVVWSVTALGISLAAVATGSALALRNSVALTPSLRRRWSISDASSIGGGVIELSMPMKIEAGLIDDFIRFIKDSMDGYGDPMASSFVSGLKEKTGDEVRTRELSFTYGEGQPSLGGIRTFNTLKLEKKKDDVVYTLVLRSKGDKQSTHRTGSFIRKLLMTWTTSRGRGAD